MQRVGEHESIVLPPLSPDQVEEIDPLIPPTSGIRLLIIDRDASGITCPALKYSLFIRLFKAISEVLVERLGRPARVLITSDERPSSDRLVKHAMQVLAHDMHELHVQHEKEEMLNGATFTHSGLSTPYSSACLALDPALDAVIVITASHNSAPWNGVKFYFQNPIPIAGDLMRDISKHAIAYERVPVVKLEGISLHGRDHETIVNEYVREVIAGIIPITGLSGKPVVLWPYMGEARGIHDLLTSLGVNVIKIRKTMEPPDPTVNFPEDEVKQHLLEAGASLAILLDADRDRIVFYLKNGDAFIKLNPNELYTSMHNLLARQFGKRIVNVRTVPSDPRSDEAACCTIESGVGYKHLGIIQFAACNKAVDGSQFSSSLMYGKDGTTRVKLDTPAKLLDFLGKHAGQPPAGEPVMMVLWEESGGHTVNLVDPVWTDGTFTGFRPRQPLLGDKFPAPAIVLLGELVARGFSLPGAIDTSIVGIRIEVPADDKRKKAIMETLERRVGERATISGKEFTIHAYRDNEDLLDIISFVSGSSTAFARPSGTGSSVRVYLFGNAASGRDELEAIAATIRDA